MADIFGREPHHYETLNVIEKRFGKDGVRRHVLESARAQNLPPHNFDAFGRFRGRILEAEPNAQGIEFMVSNLTAVQQMVKDILYLMFRADQFITFNRMIDETADNYAYRVGDMVGEADWIEASGTDAPSATATQKLVAWPIYRGGIVPMWTFDDIRRAMKGDFPLATKSLEAGVTGSMNQIEKVTLLGSDLHGTKGLLNSDTVITVNSATAFSSQNNDQLLAYLQDRISNFISSSGEIVGRELRGGMSIYLPTVQFGRVTSRRLQDINMSVWQYLQMNNHWREQTGEDIALRSVRELKDRAANGTDDRMVIGLTRNPDVVEMAMPIEPRVIHLVTSDYGMRAPMEHKIGQGPSWLRPFAVEYFDGV